MLRAIQKIVKNGNSAQITIPRPILFTLDLLPGEQVYLWTDGDGVAHFKKWKDDTDTAVHSPGLLPTKPEPAQP